MKAIIFAIAICLTVAGYQYSSANKDDATSVPIATAEQKNSAHQVNYTDPKGKIAGGSFGVVSAILKCPDNARTIIFTRIAPPACTR